MIETSSPLWPYVLITVFWAVVCGWLLRRALKRQGTAADRPSRLRADEDTQAGRI